MTLKLAGKQFGRLLVLKRLPARGGETQYRWKCQCDCGTITEILGSQLTCAGTKSCGCYRRDVARKRATKHGYAGTKIYMVWQAMIARCTKPKHKDYKNYGGRGISVCKRWRVFVNFLTDMGLPPPKKSLDRIDNDGNYEPGNCRWATSSEQYYNRRDLLRAIVDGSEAPQ